jgi:peptide/nickel transport system substrate-binding protein
MAIYREIGRRIAEDFPYTFLYIRTSLYAVGRDVRGLNFSPRGPYSFTPGTLSLWKRRAPAAGR